MKTLKFVRKSLTLSAILAVFSNVDSGVGMEILPDSALARMAEEIGHKIANCKADKAACVSTSNKLHQSNEDTMKTQFEQSSETYEDKTKTNKNDQ